MHLRNFHIVLLLLIIACAGCDTIDLYERMDTIPGHQWRTDYKPRFTIKLQDTAADHQLYITLRHNERYNYNNIWLNLYAQAPDGSREKFTLELPLAHPEKGWLGSGMDDLYDHRVPVTLDPQRFRFSRAGEYVFTLEHIMREDPLLHILNVGVRLEKK